MSATIVGLDTGYFIRVLEAEPRALELWRRVRVEGVTAVISCLTLYELEKLGLRGSVEKRAAEVLVEELPILCRVVWPSEPELLRHAARLAHGNGLAMADALILGSLIEAKVEEIYTTDSDLARYGPGPKIVKL